MNSFTHMSCKFIRLFETIFYFSKTIPAYLQYSKELFANWSCHCHMTGLPVPDPSLMGHPWDNLGRWIHDRIHSQLPNFPNSNTSCLNNGIVFHQRVGYNPRLLLSMHKSIIECIHKGGGHTRYVLQYINLYNHNIFISVLIFNKGGEIGRPSFY